MILWRNINPQRGLAFWAVALETLHDINASVDGLVHDIHDPLIQTVLNIHTQPETDHKDNDQPIPGDLLYWLASLSSVMAFTMFWLSFVM